MKNILVAIDFSDITGRLIEKAVQLATKFDAKLWLIHVAAPTPDFVGYDVGPQYIRDARAEVLREEHRKLQTHAARLNDDGLKAEALLIQGPTVETLVKEAKILEVDLLILGSEDHGKLFDTIFGSVWKEVVKKAKIPVLIVPA
jgi:nucleotide-binding universal stress UspA family protein